jgi:hypothetical protein
MKTDEVLQGLLGAFALGSANRPLPQGVGSKPLLDAHAKGLMARMDYLESLQAEGRRLIGTPATDPRDITR